jgi:hypothetical protein
MDEHIIQSPSLARYGRELKVVGWEKTPAHVVSDGVLSGNLGKVEVLQESGK